MPLFVYDEPSSLTIFRYSLMASRGRFWECGPEGRFFDVFRRFGLPRRGYRRFPPGTPDQDPYERKLLPTGCGDLTGRTHSLAVRIKVYGQMHRGIVRRPPFSAVLAVKLSKVHLIHTFPDQPRRVIFPRPSGRSLEAMSESDFDFLSQIHEP